MENLLDLIEELAENSSLKLSLDKQISHNFQEKDYGSTRRFLGAHPINMSKSHLEIVAQSSQDFLVCEKSDGVRYLLIVLKNGMAFFHGRFSGANYESVTQYLQIKDFEFSPNRNESNEIEFIFDGELIEDNAKSLYFLLFDTLYFQGKKVFSKNYLERLELAKKYYNQLEDIFDFDKLSGKFVKPKIEIRLKDFFFPNDVKFLFKEYISELSHENDGLIFTRISSEYQSGQNDNIFKWKPSNLTTIDFLAIPNPKLKGILDLEFEPIQLFLFYEQDNVNVFELFDLLFPSSQEEAEFACKNYQESFAESRENVNFGIICECSMEQTENSNLKRLFGTKTDEEISHLTRTLLLNSSIGNNSLERAMASFIETLNSYKNANFKGNWKLLRVRKDKSRPNSSAIGRNVVKVIRDNIEASQLIERLSSCVNHTKKIKMY